MMVETMDIEKLIEQAVNKAVKATMAIGIEKGKIEAKNLFKLTESRLYAYPELKKNIEKYNLDIADLRLEEPGRSRDIVLFNNGGGARFSPEEIQEARIMILRKKIYRDQREIDEIEFAIKTVVEDEYYPVIEMKYFQGRSDEDIAEQIACDASTVRRNKSRLIRRVAIKLYGAEAVE